MLIRASGSNSVALRPLRISDNLELYPGGAALLRDDGVLVVADMHLGCEAALEYEGLSLPRMQTRKIGAYMDEIIEEVRPSRVVVAGDLKHNFSRNLVQEWDDVSRFVERLSGRVVLEVVKGNHDNFLGAILSGFDIALRKEVVVGNTRVLHGHAGERVDGPMIIGHIHPSIRLSDSVGASIKDHCYLWDPERDTLVLPALSILAAGIDVVSSADVDSISPLLGRGGLASCHPIVFSGNKALKFPTVRELRMNL